MSGNMPKVSLLVAMRNEASHIERCLISMRAQDYPADSLEVLVLDGESDDGSRKVAERFCNGHPNWFVVLNPGRTQARGWNLGIERSCGDILGIVSGHAELAPTYVSQCVETLQRSGADLVGGPVHAVSAGRMGRAIALGTSAPFGTGGARFRYTESEEEVDTVFMGVCWREIYRRIGGFDEEMVRNQDDEFSYRLRKAGGRIVCNPAIQSRYYNRVTLGSLARQYFAYGYWKMQVMRRHPAQMQLRHFAPAAFVASLLGVAALGLAHPIGWRLAGWLAAVYGLANLAAAICAARKGEWSSLPLLPVVFCTLHLSYGLGFLAGGARYLLEGWRRREKLEGTAPSL
jgi:succinoglycan biosynthesis protein ExoA